MRQLVFLFCLLLTLSACVPSRPPVPPGVIPKQSSPTISDEQYGHDVLQELSKEFELDYNHPRATEVQNVVDKLVQAVPGTSGLQNSPPWHVYIFKAPQVKNAAATRGNHLFIWSGLLDTTRSEAELATIFSHEISHVLANHTDPDPNEELRKMLIQVGAVAAGVAVASLTRSPGMADNLGRLTADVTNAVGQGIFEFPYSREKELEADRIGLFLMAEAGYDPQTAVEFWGRIQYDPNIPSLPAFLSTHPPAEERIVNLKANLQQAEGRYRQKLSGIHSETSAQTDTTLPYSPPTNRGPRRELYREGSAPKNGYNEFAIPD